MNCTGLNWCDFVLGMSKTDLESSDLQPDQSKDQITELSQQISAKF